MSRFVLTHNSQPAGYTLIEMLFAMSIAASLLIAVGVASSSTLRLTHQYQKATQINQLIYTTHHLNRAIAASEEVMFDAITHNKMLVLKIPVSTTGTRDCLNQQAGLATEIIAYYQFDAQKFDGSILCRSSLAARSDHIANHIANWSTDYIRLTTNGTNESSIRIVPLTTAPSQTNQTLLALTHRIALTSLVPIHLSQATMHSVQTRISIPNQ